MDCFCCLFPKKQYVEVSELLFQVKICRTVYENIKTKFSSADDVSYNGMIQKLCN